MNRRRWVWPLIGAVLVAVLALLLLSSLGDEGEAPIPVETTRPDDAADAGRAVDDAPRSPRDAGAKTDPFFGDLDDAGATLIVPSVDPRDSALTQQWGGNEEELARDGEPEVCSMKTQLPATIEFVNDCAQSVDVSWIDFDCRERVYRTMDAGTSFTQTTHVTHAWRVRTSPGGRLLQQNVVMSSAPPLVVRACSDHTVSAEAPVDAGIPVLSCAPREVKPREPPQCSVRAKTAGVELTFENNCQGTAVAIFWVDYDCKERPYGTLNTGATKKQQTFVTHTWRFRDATTGKLHGEFIPRAPVAQTVATCDCAPR